MGFLMRKNSMGSVCAKKKKSSTHETVQCTWCNCDQDIVGIFTKQKILKMPQRVKKKNAFANENTGKVCMDKILFVMIVS